MALPETRRPSAHWRNGAPCAARASRCPSASGRHSSAIAPGRDRAGPPPSCAWSAPCRRRSRRTEAVIGGLGAGEADLNLSFWLQSNLPESTTTPPMELPWPHRNLVVEWMTISAPHSNGWQSQGEARVLSTISGSLASWAMAAIGSMSAMTPPGLAMLSMKIALHFGVSAALEVRGLVGIDEDHLPAELLEGLAELGDGAAIELASRRRMRRPLHEGEEGQHLRRVAGGAGGGAAPVLQAGDTSLPAPRRSGWSGANRCSRRSRDRTARPHGRRSRRHRPWCDRSA